MKNESFVKAKIRRRYLNEVSCEKDFSIAHKKRQATYITPLRPLTFAAFPPWRIQQELVV
jgi:hypothetical protein